MPLPLERVIFAVNDPPRPLVPLAGIAPLAEVAPRAPLDPRPPLTGDCPLKEPRVLVGVT